MFLTKDYFNPRPCRGRGLMQPLMSSFRKGRRTARRMGLKFCIAYGSSFTKFWQKNVFTGSGQITELWRHRRYSLRRTFSRTSCFQPPSLLPLTGLEIIYMIQFSRWPHLTFDVTSRPFKGHPKLMTFTDLIHAYLVANLAILGISSGPENEYLAIFSNDMFIKPVYTIQCQSWQLT